MSTPDILYEPNFYSDADALFTDLIRTVVWDESMQARKTASFGIPYNYSNVVYPEVAMPDELASLIEKLSARLGFVPNNCLANYYPEGSSSMGFHRDDTANLVNGTGVAIVSLGAQRTLYFRLIKNRSHRIGFDLAKGSLLYMPPGVQDQWQHGLLGDASVLSPRISLTFRRVVAHADDV